MANSIKPTKPTKPYPDPIPIFRCSLMRQDVGPRKSRGGSTTSGVGMHPKQRCSNISINGMISTLAESPALSERD